MIPTGATFVIYGVARHPVTNRPTLRLNSRRKLESGSTSLSYEWGLESWPDTKVGTSRRLRACAGVEHAGAGSVSGSAGGFVKIEGGQFDFPVEASRKLPLSREDHGYRSIATFGDWCVYGARDVVFFKPRPGGGYCEPYIVELARRWNGHTDLLAQNERLVTALTKAMHALQSLEGSISSSGNRTFAHEAREPIRALLAEIEAAK